MLKIQSKRLGAGEDPAAALDGGVCCMVFIEVLRRFDGLDLLRVRMIFLYCAASAMKRCWHRPFSHRVVC